MAFKLTTAQLRAGYYSCRKLADALPRDVRYDYNSVQDAYRKYFKDLAKRKKIVAIGYGTNDGHSYPGRFVIGTIARTEDYSDRIVVINRNGQSEEVRFYDIDRICVEGTFTTEWRNYGRKEY